MAKKRIEYLPKIKYLEVDITAADILDLGNGVTLLAPAGEGKYYNIENIMLEYTEGTASYTWLGNIGLFYGGQRVCVIDPQFINNGNNTTVQVKPNVPVVLAGATYPIVQPNNINQNTAFSMSTLDSSSPTVGDGTIKAKIWYTVQTFG